MQPQKLSRNSTAFHDLGVSDKAIKLQFFPILMRVFQKWLNELHSMSGLKNIASPYFHAGSFVCK